MTKKHFIALANAIRWHNNQESHHARFKDKHLDTLARFCQSQNYNFDRGRWLAYIAGECGPNGGKVKKS